jgi:hypothetical protein
MHDAMQGCRIRWRTCMGLHAAQKWPSFGIFVARGVQDVKIFKRRKWKYLILDEAHMIKNWRSQRWQALLNFSARHRLLITGTPLQVPPLPLLLRSALCNISNPRMHACFGAKHCC